MPSRDLKQSANIFDLIYALMILVFPLIYIKGIVDPVVTPRQVWWGAAIVVALLLLVLRVKQIRFPFRDPVVMLLGALPLLYLFSVVQSISVVESWYTISKWVLYSIFPILTAYLLYNGLLNRRVLHICMVTLAAFACVATAVQMIQVSATGVNIFKEFNLYAVKATFGHKNLLSSMLFMCVPFCIFFYTYELGKKRWLGIVVAAISVVLVILLQTRAVLVAVLISFIITSAIGLILFRKRSGLKWMKWISMGFFVFLLSTAAVIYIKREIFSHVTRTESARERIGIWNNTTQMIREHPMAGVGAGNWQIHFPKYGLTRFYDTNYLISEGLTNFQRPHNDFLWVFSETGIAGFLAYCSIFIIILIYLVGLLKRATNSAEQLRLLVLLFTWIGYAVIACFDFPLERMEHQMVWGLMIAIVLSEKFRSENSLATSVSRFVLFIPLLLAAFSVYIAVKRMQGEKYSYKMIMAHRQGAWVRMISEGNRAINPFYNMDPFSIPVKWYVGVGEFTLGDIPAAKRSFEEAYQLHPNQVHVLNNYATCFEKEGNHDAAIAMFEEMYRISPLFSDGIINLSGSYFNAGRFEDAFLMISRFKYDINNPRSQEFMAVICAKKMELMLAENHPEKVKEKIRACMPDRECILTQFRESQKQGMRMDEWLMRGE